MKKQSAYPLLDTLKKLGLKPTRANYLAIDGWDNPNRKLTAEEEMELPHSSGGKMKQTNHGHLRRKRCCHHSSSVQSR